VVQSTFLSWKAIVVVVRWTGDSLLTAEVSYTKIVLGTLLGVSLCFTWELEWYALC